MLLSGAPSRRPPALAAAYLTLLAAGCGAKSGIEVPVCDTDAACDDGLLCTGIERCVEARCRAGAPPPCDDGDPCTRDTCVEPDPDAGEPGGCRTEDLRRDDDGDGFDALVAELGPACGPDCDDADPDVFPGAAELCNGRDDDCDGEVDEGATFDPEAVENRVTRDPQTTTPGGVAWSDRREGWGVVYTRTEGVSGGGSSVVPVFFQELAADGRAVGEPVRVLERETIALGPRIAAGDGVYGVVWQDQRVAGTDYEVWFNRLLPTGQKLGPDVRVTAAPGRSSRPDLLWTGGEWVVAWQDERDGADGAELYLTFLDFQGLEIGDDRRLTRARGNSEAPVLALDGDVVGVAFTDTRNDPDPFDLDVATQVFFLAADLEGDVVVPEVPLSALRPRTGSVAIAAVGGAFLVAWEERNDAGDTDVVGARVPADGGPFEGPFTLVGGPDFAREPDLLVVGDDTVVLSFSDDRDDPPAFAQWVALFDPDLMRVSDDFRASFGDASSTRGALAEGDLTVGLVYEDRRDEGLTEAYFTRLLCVDPVDLD